jgi:hypothetical protein
VGVIITICEGARVVGQPAGPKGRDAHHTAHAGRDSRIVQLLYAPGIRNDRGMRIEIASVNSELAVLRYFSGALESVQTFATCQGRITTIHVQRNPDKLARFVARQAGFKALDAVLRAS